MGREDRISLRWNHLFFILLLAASWSACARNAPPVLAPLVDVPERAAWVDLAGDGADSGRAASGLPVFTRASLDVISQ